MFKQFLLLTLFLFSFAILVYAEEQVTSFNNIAIPFNFTINEFRNYSTTRTNITFFEQIRFHVKDLTNTDDGLHKPLRSSYTSTTGTGVANIANMIDADPDTYGFCNVASGTYGECNITLYSDSLLYGNNIIIKSSVTMSTPSPKCNGTLEVYCMDDDDNLQRLFINNSNDEGTIHNTTLRKVGCKQNLTIMLRLRGYEGGAGTCDVNSDPYIRIYDVSFINQSWLNLSVGSINNSILPTITSSNYTYFITDDRISSNTNFNFTFFGNGVFNMTHFLMSSTYPKIDNCSAYEYPLYNLTYRDSDSNALITVDNAFDLTLDYNGQQDTISGGYINQNKNGFCTNVNLSYYAINVSLFGTMTLTKDEYATNFYNVYDTAPLYAGSPPITQTLYLSLLNETSTITFNWLTTEYQSFDGILKIYQCDGEGNRNLISQTDIIDGEAFANLELLNKLYSYEVVVDGVTYTDEDGFTRCHSESSTERTYYVDLGTVDLTDFVSIYNIECNLTKPSNMTAKMVWGNNPESDSAITGCIFGYRADFNGMTEVYQNCTTTGNSLIVGIPDNGLDYMITGKIYQNGYSIPCDQMLDYSSSKTAAENFGLSGIFAIILIIASMVLLYSDFGWKQDIGAGIGLLVAWFLGITNFGWLEVSAMIFFLGTVVWIGRSVETK